jgi:hypothetical protein
MADRDPEKPSPRTERLRSALRENLKRRKEQARERAQSKPEPADDEGQRPNSARISEDHGQ